MLRSTVAHIIVLPLLCMSAYSFNTFAEGTTADVQAGASSDCSDTDSGNTASQSGEGTTDDQTSQPAAIKSASPE